MDIAIYQYGTESITTHPVLFKLFTKPAPCTRTRARTHLEHLEVLSAEAVPGLAQARYAAMTEPADDGEHGVEVLGVLAVTRHFDEVLEQLGALDDGRLAHHLAHHPEHLSVHQLETHTQRRDVSAQ